MRRAWGAMLAVVVLAGSVGCCASPGRFYQNAYGFNCPDIEKYSPGPPPPVTTPPGFYDPALHPTTTERPI